jgi:hypothetical protein
MYTKADPPPVVAVYSWTGLYVGGNIGYGGGNGDTFFDPLPTAAGFGGLAPTTLSSNPKGVLAQIGYNRQTGVWVWRIEADISGADINGPAVQSPIIPFNGIPFGVRSALATSEKFDWCGAAWDLPQLPSAPVCDRRLAYGDVKYTSNSNFLPVGWLEQTLLVTARRVRCLLWHGRIDIDTVRVPISVQSSLLVRRRVVT